MLRGSDNVHPLFFAGPAARGSVDKEKLSEGWAALYIGRYGWWRFVCMHWLMYPSGPIRLSPHAGASLFLAIMNMHCSTLKTLDADLGVFRPFVAILLMMLYHLSKGKHQL